MTLQRHIFLAAALVLAACSREPTYRTVSDFVDDPALLEAALVRCTGNRAESRYEAECINAREAVKLLEMREEEQRRAEREAQSQRKREALRRTQQAAAEARRRAVEDARLREEAEYQAQFGAAPPEGGDAVGIDGEPARGEPEDPAPDSPGLAQPAPGDDPAAAPETDRIAPSSGEEAEADPPDES